MTPQSTDAVTYKPAFTMSPRSSNSTTSREKVEKVVNAPNTPTATKARNSALGDQTRADASTNTPIAKDPNTLQTNIPQGNPEPIHALT